MAEAENLMLRLLVKNQALKSRLAATEEKATVLQPPTAVALLTEPPPQVEETKVVAPTAALGIESIRVMPDTSGVMPAISRTEETGVKPGPSGMRPVKYKTKGTGVKPSPMSRVKPSVPKIKGVGVKLGPGGVKPAIIKTAGAGVTLGLAQVKTNSTQHRINKAKSSQKNAKQNKPNQKETSNNDKISKRGKRGGLEHDITIVVKPRGKMTIEECRTALEGIVGIEIYTFVSNRQPQLSYSRTALTCFRRLLQLLKKVLLNHQIY